MSYEAWGEPEDSPYEAAIEAGWIDPTDQTKALIDVMNERDRQVNEEGFTAEHDDGYAGEDLARAAACYVMYPVMVRFLTSRMDVEADSKVYAAGEPPNVWPWSRARWKPTTPRCDLVKAAALILAEIERLDRAEVKVGK